MKCTCTLQRCVLVEIKGKSQGKHLIRDDGGFSNLFSKFLFQENIHPVRFLSCGGGHYTGIFTEEDAEKICLWLKTQGIKRKIE